MKKGITLIALIITIIVLLILAGISISLVMGDNGILSKAQKSKKQTVIGDVKDTAEIIRGEYEVDNKGKSPTSRYIIEKLIEQGKITSSQVEDYGDDTGVGIIIVENENVEISGFNDWVMAWTYNDNTWSETKTPNDTRKSELVGDVVAIVYLTDTDEYWLDITGNVDIVSNVREYGMINIEKDTQVASLSVLDAKPIEQLSAIYYPCIYPWTGMSNIVKLTINDGITGIGADAFRDMSFNELSLGNTIEYIGDWAFVYCSLPEEIIIPDSVINLNHGAFQQCKGLKRVVLGNSVETIGRGCFYQSVITDIDISTPAYPLFFFNFMFSPF